MDMTSFMDDPVTSTRLNSLPEISMAKRVDVGGVSGKVFIQDSWRRRVKKSATLVRQLGNLSLEK